MDQIIVVDSFSQGSQYHNSTSTPIKVGGRRMEDSHKVAGSSDSKPNGINSGCFEIHISQYVATSMLSPTSQLCGDSPLAVYLCRKHGDIYRPLEHLPTSESHSKSRLFNF